MGQGLGMHKVAFLSMGIKKAIAFTLKTRASPV